MASKYPDIYGAMASCGEDYCGYAGDPWDDVAWFYGRYYGQDGPLRDHPRENNLWRLGLALEGSSGTTDWTVSAVFSGSERYSGGGDTMVYRDARARQGLGGFECEATVPNEYDEHGNLAFSMETLMAHAGQGPCRYWIPFSNSMPGSHSQVRNGIDSNPDFNPALSNQPLLDYMVTELGGTGETSLMVLEGVVSGELPFELGGGMAQHAVGAHWRYETYQSGPWDINNFDLFPCAAGPEIKNCTTNRNGLFGFLPPSTDIDQDRNIYAVFGELNFPFSDALEGQLSVRYENYGSATGSSVDPKAAIRWQMTPSIGMRASVGTTFRGPTLNQTVADDSSNSLQYVGATGAFKRIDTKGNADLEPETAGTVNVGLLVDHDGLILGDDNLFVTLDYWSYDFEKPLVTEPFGAVLAAACPGDCDPSSPYFDRITFGGPPATANVEIIDVFIINGPDIQTDGFDFTARYGLPVGPGLVTVGVTGTLITSYDIGAWELGEAYDALGSMNYGTSLARSLVEWKGRGLFNYAAGPVNVRYNVNYIGEYERDTADVTVKEHWTHDLHANYQMLDDSLELWASVINITDEAPPFTGIEMNYDAFTHNPFGRMVKVGFTYSTGN